MSSVAAGCRYCQAHEAVDAKMRGVDDEKITAIWDFERSPLYDDAERAALRFARDASLVPNEVTPARFAELREHWDDGQIVEMLAVIGLFGFLNRWNDTMATDLEEIPSSFATERYGDRWEAGKHRTGGGAYACQPVSSGAFATRPRRSNPHARSINPRIEYWFARIDTTTPRPAPGPATIAAMWPPLAW